MESLATASRLQFCLVSSKQNGTARISIICPYLPQEDTLFIYLFIFKGVHELQVPQLKGKKLVLHHHHFFLEIKTR